MIWCIEDDASIREIEVYTLRSTGFSARGLETGDEFFTALEEETPELVILDIMLPGEDGVAVLRRLRAMPGIGNIPVIMATAKGAEYDKVSALDLGADDYLVKPFGMMEMVSRVKAVLRRCAPTAEVLRLGGVEMNPRERTVTVGGVRVELTYKEYEILRLFLTEPGAVFTRDRLFVEVWGENYVGETRTVDMHIRTLRQKLGQYGPWIRTVRNVGYRMEAD